jgi:hypothetical protein
MINENPPKAREKAWRIALDGLWRMSVVYR